MKKIGLLSDTHSFLDPTILEHFSECDELWHAGDIGNPEVINQLEAFKPVRAVYGNIDSSEIRKDYPLDLRFDCEGMDVFITHIGGYPERYTKRVRELMQKDPPGLYICGHSHILKVMYDKKYQVLHMNPGACGHEGFHQFRTVLRFDINKGRVENAEVIELGNRGQHIIEN